MTHSTCGIAVCHMMGMWLVDAIFWKISETNVS